MRTDPTAVALLAAIVAFPDEDDPRLRYADYLDGLDTVSVPCPKCKGSGGITEQGYREFSGEYLKFRKCPVCNGTGRVPDTAARDRAEFIRVQVELVRRPNPDTQCVKCGRHATDVPNQKYCGHGGDKDNNHNYQRHPRKVELLARESALLATNRERWLRVECPECRGSGPFPLPGDVISTFLRASAMSRHPAVSRVCPACDGTGDIGGLVKTGALPSSDPADYVLGDYLAPVVFRRGFPDEVQGCRLEDVFEQKRRLREDGKEFDPETVWSPPPWILRVFAHHPTIRRVPLVDRVPYRTGAGFYRWWKDDPAHPESSLPGLIYDAMHLRLREKAEWPRTADAATDALAVAVADVMPKTGAE